MNSARDEVSQQCSQSAMQSARDEVSQRCSQPGMKSQPGIQSARVGQPGMQSGMQSESTIRVSEENSRFFKKDLAIVVGENSRTNQTEQMPCLLLHTQYCCIFHCLLLLNFGKKQDSSHLYIDLSSHPLSQTTKLATLCHQMENVNINT